jgi:hypothetical protein
MEVMEYLRVAPLLLFSETKKPRAAPPSRRCTDRKGSHLPMIHIPKRNTAVAARR